MTSLSDAKASNAVDTRVEGVAFHPGLGRGRASGWIHVDGDSIRFEPRDETQESIVLGLDDLELRLGGANDRVLFFSHPAQTETTFHTTDHSILEAPPLLARPALAEQVRAASAKKQRGRLLGTGVAVAVVAAALGLYQLKDPLAGVIARRVPPSVEIKTGELLFGQLRGAAHFVDSPELSADLDQLLRPLQPILAGQPFPFQFHLVGDESINAFAMPGGIIVLHTGLILQASSSEEVLGVLAHEIAHVSERHILRGLIAAAGMSFIVRALVGDASGLVAIAADRGLGLLDLSFSRDLERQADEVGFSYLVESGVDPSGMVSFFETLKAEEAKSLEGNVGRALTFLRTHPASQQRIDLLTAMLHEGPRARPTSSDLDFEAFQARLRDALDHLR